MSKFIVLTGIDGSGKDFVAKHLQAADPGSKLIQTPTEPFLRSRLEVDRFALEIPAAHYFFYLASIIHASSQVGQMLKTSNVYCARYLLSTVVYHRAMGLSVDLEYETPLYKITQPDLTVFLVVDERTRQERLRTRGKFTIGDKIVDEEQFRNTLLREYQSFSGFFVTVNNYGRDIKDVVAEIRGYIFNDVL